MPIVKAAALAKAKSHFDFFSEARDELSLNKLYSGAFGYCQALWKIGLITEEELARLKVEAENAKAEWYRRNFPLA